MTAHTPGPWEVEPCTEGGAFEITEGIGSVGTAWGENDEALANARLMAAAPELLMVCQCIAGDLEALLGGDDFSGMSDAEMFGVMLESLKAAIAKAEGTAK